MKTLPLTLTNATFKLAFLVQFSRMDGTVLRVTPHQFTIIASGTSPATTWSPVAGLTVSAIKHAIGGEPQQLEITASHSVGGTFDTEDIDNRLYSGAVVSIYITERTTTYSEGAFVSTGSNTGLYFTGTVEGIGYTTTGEVTFDVRGQAVRSAAFVQKFHPMCRTDLFSSLCTLNQADFDDTAEVLTIVDRHTITLTNLSTSRATGWYNDGVARTGTGFAFVVASWTLGTVTLTTYQPICETHLSVGMVLTLWPGCDKRIPTCFSKFNNAANFQGEAHFLGAAAVNG